MGTLWAQLLAAGGIVGIIVAAIAKIKGDATEAATDKAELKASKKDVANLTAVVVATDRKKRDDYAIEKTNRTISDDELDASMLDGASDSPSTHRS